MQDSIKDVFFIYKLLGKAQGGSKEVFIHIYDMSGYTSYATEYRNGFVSIVFVCRYDSSLASIQMHILHV